MAIEATRPPQGKCYLNESLLFTKINEMGKNKNEEAKIYAPPGGLEPPTFRLTAERASQLRHGGLACLHIFCYLN